MKSIGNEKNLKNKEKYISLTEATKLCQYSQEYLSLRARQGRLKAVKQGRNWMTTPEWLKEYNDRYFDKKNFKNEKEYISLTEATKLCQYSQEYLSLRARQGRLKAVKQGRNWATTDEWLKEYIAYCEGAEKGIKQKLKPDIGKVPPFSGMTPEPEIKPDFWILLLNGVKNRSFRALGFIKNATLTIINKIAPFVDSFSQRTKIIIEPIHDLLRFINVWRSEEARGFKFKQIFIGLAVISTVFGMLLIISSVGAREFLGEAAINLIEKNSALTRAIDRQSGKISRSLIKGTDLAFDSIAKTPEFIKKSVNLQSINLLQKKGYQRFALFIEKADFLVIKKSTTAGLKVILFKDSAISRLEKTSKNITNNIEHSLSFMRAKFLETQNKIFSGIDKIADNIVAGIFSFSKNIAGLFENAVRKIGQIFLADNEIIPLRPVSGIITSLPADEKITKIIEPTKVITTETKTIINTKERVTELTRVTETVRLLDYQKELNAMETKLLIQIDNTKNYFSNNLNHMIGYVSYVPAPSGPMPIQRFDSLSDMVFTGLINQTGDEQVSFSGNVDIKNGLDILGGELNILNNATSTFSNGIQINSGCFLLPDGSCAGAGGGSGGVLSGTAGQISYYAATGTILTATSSIFINTAGYIGIGTSSPSRTQAINGDFYLTGGLYNNTTGAGINGYILQTTGSETKWVSTSTLGLLSSVAALNDLSDVDTSGVAYGNLIFYNGSTWEDVATSSLKIALSDTIGTLTASHGGTGISSNPAYGDLLVGNAGGTYTLTATSSLGLLDITGADTRYLLLSSLNDPLTGGLETLGDITLQKNTYSQLLGDAGFTYSGTDYAIQGVVGGYGEYWDTGVGDISPTTNPPSAWSTPDGTDNIGVSMVTVFIDIGFGAPLHITVYSLNSEYADFMTFLTDSFGAESGSTWTEDYYNDEIFTANGAGVPFTYNSDTNLTALGGTPELGEYILSNTIVLDSATGNATTTGNFTGTDNSRLFHWYGRAILGEAATPLADYALVANREIINTSGVSAGLGFQLTLSAPSASSGDYYGIFGAVSVGGTSNYTSNIGAANSSLFVAGTGTLSHVYGTLTGLVLSGGATTNKIITDYAGYGSALVDVSGGGALAITNFYHFKGSDLSSASGINVVNNYGIIIPDNSAYVSGASWGIHNLDRTYLAKYVAIGTTTTARAHVTIQGGGIGTWGVMELLNGSSASLMKVLENGNVGIASTSPNWLLSMESGSAGGYYDSTLHQWVNPSSRAIKQDISLITGDERQEMLGMLSGLQINKYHFISDVGQYGEQAIWQYGVIAEDTPSLLTGHGRNAIQSGSAIQFLLTVSQTMLEKINNLESASSALSRLALEMADVKMQLDEMGAIVGSSAGNLNLAGSPEGLFGAIGGFLEKAGIAFDSGWSKIKKLVAGKIETGEIRINAEIPDQNFNPPTNGQTQSSDTIGEGKIVAGATEVFIETSSVELGSKVFITPISLTDQQLAVTQIEACAFDSPHGFKVQIKNPAQEAIKFNWWIVQAGAKQACLSDNANTEVEIFNEMVNSQIQNQEPVVENFIETPVNPAPAENNQAPDQSATSNEPVVLPEAPAEPQAQGTAPEEAPADSNGQSVDQIVTPIGE